MEHYRDAEMDSTLHGAPQRAKRGLDYNLRIRTERTNFEEGDKQDLGIASMQAVRDRDR